MRSASAAPAPRPEQTVVPFRKAKGRRREEIAFLPAALEIAEAPPSPIDRAIAIALMLLVCAALAWSAWGTIDIVASATGKVVSSGRSKVVQPFETGVVRAIHVQDGQAVKSGDVLIELDPTVNAAERDHLHDDLMAERLNMARLRAALASGEDASTDLVPPADADPSLVATQRQLLANQVSEHRAKLASLARQQAQKEAEHQTIAATIHKLDALLPVTQQRVDIRKILMEKEIGSKLTYYETLQLLIEQQEELRVQSSHLKEAEAAVAAIRETRTQAVAEYRKSLSDELAKSEQKANGVARDLIKAQQRTRLQQLTSPVDGVVQQLAVHTVGGVVTPAQSLLVIVPSATRLEVEAMISNRDIGFVEVGQDAAVKIDTLQLHPLRPAGGTGAERLAGRHHPRPSAGKRPRARDAARQQRAQRAGAELQRTHLARSHANAGGRSPRQPVTGNGRDSGDQDRLAHHFELPVIAIAALPARDHAGTLMFAD